MHPEEKKQYLQTYLLNVGSALRMYILKVKDVTKNIEKKINKGVKRTKTMIALGSKHSVLYNSTYIIQLHTLGCPSVKHNSMISYITLARHRSPDGSAPDLPPLLRRLTWEKLAVNQHIC